MARAARAACLRAIKEALIEYLSGPPKAAYIKYKANNYLKVGPARYRKRDALGEPSAGVEPEVLEAVRFGFEQIVNGAGFTEERPLRDVGISGLYALMRIVHFEVVSQSMTFLSEKEMLDRMEFRHVMDGDVVTVFNVVPLPDVSGLLDEGAG